MDDLTPFQGLVLTPLKILGGENGRVLHAMRSDSPGFGGFGEAYFSTVRQGVTKGWKKHRSMLMNLVVPVGSIRFFLYDDRSQPLAAGPRRAEIVLGESNYQRLTVPPGVWLAFQGVGAGENWLLNLASIPHDPGEAEARPLDDPMFGGMAG